MVLMHQFLLKGEKHRGSLKDEIDWIFISIRTKVPNFIHTSKVANLIDKLRVFRFSQVSFHFSISNLTIYWLNFSYYLSSVLVKRPMTYYPSSSHCLPLYQLCLTFFDFLIFFPFLLFAQIDKYGNGNDKDEYKYIELNLCNLMEAWTWKTWKYWMFLDLKLQRIMSVISRMLVQWIQENKYCFLTPKYLSSSTLHLICKFNPFDSSCSQSILTMKKPMVTKTGLNMSSGRH